MTNTMSIAERVEKAARDLEHSADATAHIEIAETLATLATELRAQVGGLARLRKWWVDCQGAENLDRAIDAEARITELEKERAEARDEASRYKNTINLLHEAAERRDALAAENAALRNALEKIANRFDYAEHSGSVEHRTRQDALLALSTKQECAVCGSGMLLSRCSDCPRITSPDKAIRRIAAMIAKMPRS